MKFQETRTKFQINSNVRNSKPVFWYLVLGPYLALGGLDLGILHAKIYIIRGCGFEARLIFCRGCAICSVIMPIWVHNRTCGGRNRWTTADTSFANPTEFDKL